MTVRTPYVYTMADAPDGDGFVAFFRRYTRSWLHALATAALTAFGTLTVVHRAFAVLAVAAYVLPPVALYLTRSRPLARPSGTQEDTPRSAGEPDDSPDRPNRQSTPDAGPGSDPRGAGEPDADATWQPVDGPTDATLFDVVLADGGAYAAGADGVVLADTGDGWDVVLDAGPAADSQTLRGVAATADGEAIWIAGDGGAVARLDAATGRHVDYSAPRDRTDAWTDVAVGGPAGDEVVLLVNGSGEVLRGRYREGEPAWAEPVKPGGGSSLVGVALRDGAVGHLCDTNDGVFETTDGGETYRRIGLESTDGTLTAVASDGAGDGTVAVTADDGVLHRHEAGTWTPVSLGDEALSAVALRDGRGLACGGRAVYGRLASDADWERTVLPEPGPFEGVDVGPGRTDGPVRAVAVGADGAIVERR